MNPKGKWHSTVNYNEIESEPKKPGGGGRALPESVRRKYARADSSGGRAVCEICNLGYGMSYIRLCKIGPFKIGHVCVFCKKEGGYIEVK